MTTDTPEVDRIAAGHRDDLLRAIQTAGRWWVPCPRSDNSYLDDGGDVTEDGLAVRAQLLASKGTSDE